MRKETYVVIGAGQAAARSVEAMRTAGFNGRIVMIGEEGYLPYERPPLSKDGLLGLQPPAPAEIFDRDWYLERSIEILLNTCAIEIDRNQQRVYLSQSKSIPYDKLLLATGSRVRRLSVRGSDLAGILSLHTIEDAIVLKKRLQSGAEVVIIGGGFVGLEVAAAATVAGCSVTILERHDSLLKRIGLPEVSRVMQQLHESQGVVIRTQQQVEAFVGTQKVGGVVCSDGSCLPADVVVTGIGAVPNVELAEAAGLAIENGILVDEFGTTSDANIFAVGDVANHPNAILGRRLRLESWQNAQRQPVAVAAAMCGIEKPYAELPWFWTDQYNVNVQIIGLATEYDDVVCRGDLAKYRGVVIYFREKHIICAAGFNVGRDIAAIKRLILTKEVINRDAISNAEIQIRDLARIR